MILLLMLLLPILLSGNGYEIDEIMNMAMFVNLITVLLKFNLKDQQYVDKSVSFDHTVNNLSIRYLN